MNRRELFRRTVGLVAGLVGASVAPLAGKSVEQHDVQLRFRGVPLIFPPPALPGEGEYVLVTTAGTVEPFYLGDRAVAIRERNRKELIDDAHRRNAS